MDGRHLSLAFRDSREERTQHGRCVLCPHPASPSRTLCAACAARQAAYRRRLAAGRRGTLAQQQKPKWISDPILTTRLRAQWTARVKAERGD